MPYAHLILCASEGSQKSGPDRLAVSSSQAFRPEALERKIASGKAL